MNIFKCTCGYEYERIVDRSHLCGLSGRLNAAEKLLERAVKFIEFVDDGGDNRITKSWIADYERYKADTEKGAGG